MRLTLIFRDREGNHGRTSTTRPLPGTVAEITAAANQFAAAVIPLSNAVLVAATCAIVVPVSIPSDSFEQSDVSRAIVVIGRSASDEYVSIAVPSARTDLPYDTSGQYAGYRIAPETWQGPPLAGTPMALWLNAGVTRPDGAEVVPQSIVAALMRNQGA